MGRHPSLSYFGDCLERCEQLVKTKLPEEEEGHLKDLVQTAAASLLSREAVLKLHRMRLQLQHPPEMELFLTPLETLQANYLMALHRYSYTKTPTVKYKYMDITRNPVVQHSTVSKCNCLDTPRGQNGNKP